MGLYLSGSIVRACRWMRVPCFCRSLGAGGGLALKVAESEQRYQGDQYPSKRGVDMAKTSPKTEKIEVCIYI